MGSRGLGWAWLMTAQAQEKETEQDARFKHIGPWEEQRKAYYKELETKPWGAVSKKYIKTCRMKKKNYLRNFIV